MLDAFTPTQAHEALDDFIARDNQSPDYRQKWQLADDFIAQLNIGSRTAIIRVVVTRILDELESNATSLVALFHLVSRLLDRELDLTDEDVVVLLMLPGKNSYLLGMYPKIISQAGVYLRTHGDSPQITAGLAQLKSTLLSAPRWNLSNNAETRKNISALSVLLGEEQAKGITPVDLWTNIAVADLKSLDEESRARWENLIELAAGASARVPSKKWIEGAQPFLDVVGRDVFKGAVLKWFEAAGKPAEGTTHLTLWTQKFNNPEHMARNNVNTDILKGLVWFASLIGDSEIIRAIGGLAAISYKKIPQIGSWSLKIGNACVAILESTSGMESVAALGKLKVKVKQAGAKRFVEKSSGKMAEQRQLSESDMEELALPTFELDSSGTRRATIGEFSYELKAHGPNKVDVTWFKGGKALASVPAQIKTEQTALLKNLKSSAKEIGEMLAAVRLRLEESYVTARTWEYEQWRTRYHDHSLAQMLVRKLIWEFMTGDRCVSAIWQGQHFVNERGELIDACNANTRVRLWHPIHATAPSVQAWRVWVENQELRQPFKQAHREIYVLTDAEREAVTQSSRFASHILRQHQFAALCKERGWQYRLMGSFDFFNLPTKVIRQTGLKIELGLAAGGEALRTGIAPHVWTQEITFHDMNAVCQLQNVSPIVFSEVLRDVDLFVGVCSIGNDPNWLEKLERTTRQAAPNYAIGYGQYVRDYSGKELSSSDEMRKDVLTRLLPKLTIASQCKLDGRFLIVSGKLRTYKIHLGSTNILMEPNNQYLCIVPGYDASGDVFLPFEGDRVLAIILSKAFMLANDTKIKDPSIVSQIKRK